MSLSHQDWECSASIRAEALGVGGSYGETLPSWAGISKHGGLMSGKGRGGSVEVGQGHLHYGGEVDTSARIRGQLKEST